jgi:hypothetical protein
LIEYVMTPASQDVPSPAFLLQEVHNRGQTVEITLNGPAQEWKSIRFHYQGLNEFECLLSRNPETGRFTVSEPEPLHKNSGEFQLLLVDILLEELGGEVTNTDTQEHFTPEQLKHKLTAVSLPSPIKTEWFWVCFSWIAVALGILMFFSVSSRMQWVAIATVLLSLASAMGFTFFKPKS